MIREGFIIEGDAAIALACVALLALSFVLYIVCRKKCTLDPDEEGSNAAMLPAHSHHLTDVESATDGFHGSRVVGSGRLGTVYRATSVSGDNFTVKRIHHHLVLGNPGVSFSSRIRTLSYANHPNVVPVLGFSEAPGERLIISEFVGETKSLDYYLHAEQGRPWSARLLSWEIRLRIAAGSARGIQHLHEGSVPGIVHGCIKPSNIMVDSDFCARICDYGLSFLVAPGDRREMAGYVDGEGNGACKENDVYGFGVVLLELLSGRRCEGGKVVEWALPLMRESRVGEVFDGRVPPLATGNEPLTRMAKVASACLGNGRKTRPSIAQVAAILSCLEMDAR